MTKKKKVLWYCHLDIQWIQIEPHSAPVVKVIKIFTSSLSATQNRLECLFSIFK
jgi:hypothetical protein